MNRKFHEAPNFVERRMGSHRERLVVIFATNLCVDGIFGVDFFGVDRDASNWQCLVCARGRQTKLLGRSTFIFGKRKKNESSLLTGKRLIAMI